MATPSNRSWPRAVGAVLVRPRLWPTALRMVGRSSPRGWWHRAPFVPRPPSAFAGFRLETQYGDSAHTESAADAPVSRRSGAPAADDLVTYLRWCRSQDRDRRAGVRRAGGHRGGRGSGRRR